MTIPTRTEAAGILASLEPRDWLLAHSSAVAEIAAFLAARLRASGHDLAPDLPETAALLHDVDKTDPLGQLRETLGHGWAGAAWLTARGLDELAPAVANHPATRLADEAAFERWLAGASLTEKVVAYADKRATLDLVPMTGRFAEWQARHPERADEIAAGLALAQMLEQQVCAVAGTAPNKVERLPWVDAAIKAAGPATAPT